MTAQKLLEIIQSEQRNGVKPNQEEELKRYIDRLLCTKEFNLSKERQDEMVEKYRYIATILPTKFQDISSYYILRERFLGFDEIVNDVLSPQADDTRLNTFPVFGTIKMPRFNAFITPTDNKDDSLIVFGESLITFAGMISKCVALSMAFEEGEDDIINFFTDIDNIKNVLDLDKTAVAHFLDLMFAYMLTFEPYYAKMFFVLPQIAPMASVLCRGFETFIAGHEYAHYLLGHRGVRNLSDLEKVNVFREIEADTLGMKIAHKRLLCDNFDDDLAIAGIYLGLKSVELTELIVNLRECRDGNCFVYETHPKASIRCESFLKGITKQENLLMIESVDFIIEYMMKEFNLMFDCFVRKFGDKFWETSDILETLQNIQHSIYERYPALC